MGFLKKKYAMVTAQITKRSKASADPVGEDGTEYTEEYIIRPVYTRVQEEPLDLTTRPRDSRIDHEAWIKMIHDGIRADVTGSSNHAVPYFANHLRPSVVVPGPMTPPSNEDHSSRRCPETGEIGCSCNDCRPMHMVRMFNSLDALMTGRQPWRVQDEETQQRSPELDVENLSAEDLDVGTEDEYYSSVESSSLKSEPSISETPKHMFSLRLDDFHGRQKSPVQIAESRKKLTALKRRLDFDNEEIDVGTEDEYYSMVEESELKPELAEPMAVVDIEQHDEDNDEPDLIQGSPVSIWRPW